MSKEENEWIKLQQGITEMYGSAVFQNANVVVRVKGFPNRIVVVVHRKIDRKETVPLGYIEGSNCLTFKL